MCNQHFPSHVAAKSIVPMLQYPASRFPPAKSLCLSAEAEEISAPPTYLSLIILCCFSFQLAEHPFVWNDKQSVHWNKECSEKRRTVIGWREYAGLCSSVCGQFGYRFCYSDYNHSCKNCDCKRKSHLAKAPPLVAILSWGGPWASLQLVGFHMV